ncbi:MAG TPA: NFACT RNA binding domain-containing protein [Candidatus Kapabacteria bacterium]|nr:NFACT RNA binding domain-containing protein [Candidatus Kapabacteria bacterium]
MLRNYYTLHHLVSELKEYIGWRSIVCFTQEKGQLVLEISNGRDTKFLIFNSDGKKDSLFISDKFKRAKQNSMEPMHDLNDETICNIALVGKNRIVKIEFNNLIAYFQLFGGENSNIFLSNFDNKIFDAFKQSELNYGKIYNYSNEEAPEFWEMNSNLKISQAISSSSYMFGKYYSNIICNKLNIDTNTLLANVDKEQISLINQECMSLKTALLNSNEFYVYEDGNEYILSLIKDETKNQAFKSNNISEAIRFRVIKEILNSNFDSNYKKVLSKLKSIVARNEKKLKFMLDLSSLEERIKNYRRFGEALMAQQDIKDRCEAKIEIEDWNGESFIINLDAKISLLQNATKFFEKAKHSEADINNRKKRTPIEQAKIDTLIELQLELESITNVKELDRFVEQNRRILEMTPEIKSNEKTNANRFREFDLGDNFKLYVGKNAANNDELTMKFAKPNDLWMHARGSSGSHTIVRLDKESKLPKHILTKAAEITAYYSGARNAKYVPVVYTFRKFVRKPKGANVGAVVISKEDVIMVEPKLPEGSVES